MRAEVLSIGTELLVGSILNTNARFLAEKLAERGVDLYRQTTIGDNVGRLSAALEEAMTRADLVICSGGLGPTDDDITMEAAARVAGVRRVLSRPTVAHIRQRLRSARLPASKLSMNQCRTPEGAVLFQNENGTAPGVLLEMRRAGETKVLLLLPGPPTELEPMFLGQAWPAIAASTRAPGAFHIRTVKIAGLGETDVAEKIGDLLKRKPPVTCGIYAKAGEVQLKIMSKASTPQAARAAAAPVERFLRRTFGRAIFGFDDDTPAAAALSALKKRRQTVALAESCTGGLVSHLLTETPGSSEVYTGGVIAYSNELKQKLLGVSGETLQRHGAVSRATALEMAQGARHALGASVGLALTGIAGPGGGSPQKPAGLVWIALADSRGSFSREFRFTGQRSTVKLKAARKALDLLRLRFS